MSTIALAPSGELPDLLTQSRAARAGVWSPWPLAVFASVAVLAAALRIWDMGAIMASSDQVAMAWMVRHSYGIKWIFAHDYGPVLPLIQRTWAEILSRLHLPIDEAAARTPIMAAGMLQLLASFGLLRRLGCERTETGAGLLAVAVLPALVSDAHYAWGYATIWLLTGTVALWATLAYLQEDRPRWLWLAGIALLLHCLSNCFAFALPVALAYVWLRALPGSAPLAACPPVQTASVPLAACPPVHSAARNPSRPPHLPRSFAVGFVLPCVVALTVIGLSWWWTGAGQVGRLLLKRQAGSTGLQLAQLADIPGMLVTHFGYLFAILAAAGLLWATWRPRYRLLAVWAWASLVPLTLLVDWHRVGYAAEYLMETAYAAGLLGLLMACALFRRLADRPRSRAAFACFAGLALLHMGIATADTCLAGGRLARLTGVDTTWGAVRPESGIKAVGWYVQAHVPDDAIIMSTHTNTGMEVSVAEYYCGRAVLADCDLLPEAVAPLIRSMQSKVDVIIVEPAWRELADSLFRFERVATIRDEGVPVRYVYARRWLRLPPVTAEAERLNREFDRHFSCRQIPQPLKGPSSFDAVLARFQREIGRN